MKQNWKLWTACLGVLFLLASCAPTAHIEKDDAADFGSYRTFAWLDKDGEGKKDKNRSNDLLEERVKAAVSRELEKTSGWKQSKNPDVLLTYDVLVERSVRSNSEPVYSRPFTRTYYNRFNRRFVNVYYPSQFMGYDNYDVPVREGTVTISMIDAGTDKTVWQGWTTEVIDSRNLSAKDVESSVKAIFRKFDVAKN